MSGLFSRSGLPRDMPNRRAPQNLPQSRAICTAAPARDQHQMPDAARERMRPATVHPTYALAPPSSACPGSVTDRLSSAAKLSASTLVGTSTSKACWLKPLTIGGLALESSHYAFDLCNKASEMCQRGYSPVRFAFCGGGTTYRLRRLSFPPSEFASTRPTRFSGEF